MYTPGMEAVAALGKRLDRDYFVRQGRRGGQKGGKATAAKRTPQQRSEAARNAVKARWAKYRKEKGKT